MLSGAAVPSGSELNRSFGYRDGIFLLFQNTAEFIAS
jgi:hypothetical protein